MNKFFKMKKDNENYNVHCGAVPTEHNDSGDRKVVGGRVPRRARAFTLAEVLITLGVVGIVAVLTVPAVVKNYRNRIYVSQLQKVSAQIADAAQSAMNDEHTDKFYETKAGMAHSCSNANNGVCEQGVGYFLNTYFKTIKKNCLNAAEPCAVNTGATYKTLAGASLANGFGGNYCIQTTNGATICGSFNPSVGGGTGGQPCLSIAVDVNGMTEPNTAGRDIFAMDIHNDGTVSDYGSGCADNSFGCASNSCGNGAGVDDDKKSVFTESCGCYSKLLKSGWVMDY